MSTPLTQASNCISSRRKKLDARLVSQACHGLEGSILSCYSGSMFCESLSAARMCHSLQQLRLKQVSCCMSREQLAETGQHLRDEQARSVAAQKLAEASQAAASRQGAALDAAKRDAADAHAQAVQYKGSLEAVQQQLAGRDSEHARQSQVLRYD